MGLPLGAYRLQGPLRRGPGHVMAPIHPRPQVLPLTSAAPRPGLRGTQPPESVLWALSAWELHRQQTPSLLWTPRCSQGAACPLPLRGLAQEVPRGPLGVSERCGALSLLLHSG